MSVKADFGGFHGGFQVTSSSELPREAPKKRYMTASSSSSSSSSSSRYEPYKAPVIRTNFYYEDLKKEIMDLKMEVMYYPARKKSETSKNIRAHILILGGEEYDIEKGRKRLRDFLSRILKRAEDGEQCLLGRNFLPGRWGAYTDNQDYTELYWLVRCLRSYHDRNITERLNALGESEKKGDIYHETLVKEMTKIRENNPIPYEEGIRLLYRLDELCQERKTNEGKIMLDIFEHINRTIKEEYAEWLTDEEKGVNIKGYDEFGQGRPWYDQPSGREYTLRGVDKRTTAYAGDVNNRVNRGNKFWRCLFGSGKHCRAGADCCHQCRTGKR